MKPPPGYAPDGLETRTLYDLKQSGRRWYQKLTAIFVNGLSFRRCEVNQAVFYRRKAKTLTVIAVHVNDCTIAASTRALTDQFKARLKDHIEITHLGELHWLPGTVSRSRGIGRRGCCTCRSAYQRVPALLRF